MEHAISVIHNVGNLVHSFTEPPTGKGIELDLGLRDHSRETQERHYKVMRKYELVFIINFIQLTCF